jgi:hypothetical protein
LHLINKKVIAETTTSTQIIIPAIAPGESESGLLATQGVVIVAFCVLKMKGITRKVEAGSVEGLGDEVKGADKEDV